MTYLHFADVVYPIYDIFLCSHYYLFGYHSAYFLILPIKFDVATKANNGIYIFIDFDRCSLIEAAKTRDWGSS